MSNHLGQLYATTKNTEKYIVLNSQNVELSGNVNINGGLAIDNIFGESGQVLTSQGSNALPIWTTVSGGVGGGGGGGESTAVYMAADASGASDGFITYSSSPIVQNCTFSNNAFSPDRTGDYKVTSNLTFTGNTATATVRIGKQLTQRLNNILTLTAARSYDFRTVQALTGSSPYTLAYTTPSGTNFQASNTGIQLHVNSGPTPTFDSIDGYIGTTAHYLSIPPSDVPMPAAANNQTFSLEFYVKFGNTSGNHYLFSAKFPSGYNNNPPYENFNLLGIHFNSGSNSLTVEGTNDVGPGTAYTFQTFMTTTITQSRFYHIVFTYARAFESGSYQNTGELRLYIDGIQKTSNSNTIAGPFGTSTPAQVNIGRDFNGNNDNGPESLRFFRYYTTSVTPDQVHSLYFQDIIELDVLSKSSGSGTVITQAIAQELATTDEIKVHAEGDFTGYSGDAALIVENIDGGTQGPAGTGFPDINTGTSGQVLTLDNSNPPQAVWMSGSTAVYMAADASGASDGFITYSSSPIVQNCTFSNNVFSPDRTGDYKVTSNLTFTGNTATATVRVGKSLTQLSNSILTAARSYDFRTASGTYTATTNLSFSPNTSNNASLTLDSGSATINTTDGYQGGTNHYIDLTSFPTGSQLPDNFAFELVFKLNSPSNQITTAYQPIFVVHKNIQGREYAQIRLQRDNQNDDLRLMVCVDTDANGNTTNEYHTAFANNYQEFEHLFIQFTPSGFSIYKNGVLATPIGTPNPNIGVLKQTTSGDTAINVSKVTLGRYLDGNGTGSDLDNGFEHMKFFRYYTTSATADEVRSLYEQHALQLDVLRKSSGSGTIFMQTIAQQLATTDEIKVHAEGDFTGYSGDAALIVENIDGGTQGPAGTGFPDINTGTSGQVLTLDSSNPPQAYWAGNGNVYCKINANTGTYSQSVPTSTSPYYGYGHTAIINSWDNTNAVSANCTVGSSIPFTATVAGTYFIHAHVSIDPTTTIGEQRITNLYVFRMHNNVPTRIAAASSEVSNGREIRNLSVSTIDTLQIGDSLEMIVQNYSGDSFAINPQGSSTQIVVHSMEGVQGPQGPAGTGFPDINTGTSGQILTLDSSNPPQAYWAGNGNVYCSIRGNASTSVGDGSLYTSWDSSNAVTSSSGIVSSTIPFIAPRAGTYYIHFYTTVKCPTNSEWSAVRLVRYFSGGSEVKVAQTRHSEIDSGNDWRPHAMSAIVTLGNAERLGVRIFSPSGNTSGINQDGTLTELTVHSMEGVQGPQGPAGTGFPEITGSTGQIIMLDNSTPPQPVWSNPINKHGHATYLASGGGLGYNQHNTSSFQSIQGGTGSNGFLSDVSVLTDTGYTSVTGMATTYTPVGVTFVPSTTAMTTASGTVTFSNNPVAAATPSRWRIITAGHYNIRVNVFINDSNADNRSQVYLWRRSGGSSQNAGTTVTLIGYTHTLQNTKSSNSDLGLNLNVEGIYQLSAFDEVYCSVNGDSTPGTYVQNLGTYFTIKSVDGIQGPQGPAGTGFPDISTGTSGQILTLDSSNPPQPVWSSGFECAQLSGIVLNNGVSRFDTWSSGFNWPYSHSNAYWFRDSDYTTDFAHGITIDGTQAQQTINGSTSDVFQTGNIPVRFQIDTTGIYKFNMTVNYDLPQTTSQLTLIYRVRRPTVGGQDSYPYDVTWSSATAPPDAFEASNLIGRSTVEFSKMLSLNVGDELYFGFSSSHSCKLYHGYNNFHILRIR